MPTKDVPARRVRQNGGDIALAVQERHQPCNLLFLLAGERIETG